VLSNLFLFGLFVFVEIKPKEERVRGEKGMRCFVCGRLLRAKTALHFKFMDVHFHLCYSHGFEVRKLILKMRDDLHE